MSFSGFRSARQQTGNTSADNQNNNNSNNQNNNNQNNSNNNNNNQNNNNNNSNNNNNNGNGSDATNDEAFLDKLWSDVQDDDKNKNNNNNNNNNNNSPAPVVKTPEEQIKAYLDSVGLKPIEFGDTDIEAVKNGTFDWKQFTDKVNNNVTQAHLQSLSSSKKMIDNAVKEAVEKAVGDSKSYFAGEQFRQVMHEKLEFTQDPAIGPVAETIAQRLMGRGATRDQAIQGVQKWFDHVFAKANPDFELNGNTRDTYRGNMRNNSKSGNVDWLDMLRGKPASQ